VNSLQTASLIFVIVFSGALFGMLISRYLPDHHLSSETKAVITASMATVGTLSAFVLGLTVSTANVAFTTRNHEIVRFSDDLIRLDRLLRRYGSASQTSREALRRYAAMKAVDLFPAGGSGPLNFDNPRTLMLLEQVEDGVSSLKPENNRQQWLQSQALQIVGELEATRWELAQSTSNLIPVPLLGAFVIWLTVIFLSFGLFAPRNATTLVALFFAAFALSAAVKIAIDMETLQGRVRLLSAPVNHALDEINSQ
jgi:hypothetical protein